MNHTKKRIDEIKNNGYKLDFGIIFDHAFENYKKIVLYAGSMLLLFSFIFIVLILTILISIFGTPTLTEALKPENLKPENFTGNFLLIYTCSMLLLSCLISPFQAGFLKMADCAEKGEEFHVSTIFEYYKPPYFGTIFIATLAISLFSLGTSSLIGLTGIQNLSILVSLIITFTTFLTIPLIVFGKLGAIEAIQSSVMIVSKQPLLIFGLLSVTMIGACIGFFAFFVGLFFTIPLIYSMQYSIYSSIIGIDKEEEIETS